MSSRIFGGLLMGVGQGIVSQAEQRKNEAIERLRMSQRDKERSEDRTLRTQERADDRAYQSERDEQMFGRQKELSDKQHQNAMEREDKRYSATIAAAQAKAGANNKGIAGYSADENRVIEDIRSRYSTDGGKTITDHRGYAEHLRTSGNSRLAEIADQTYGRGVMPPIMSREEAEMEVDAAQPGAIRGLLGAKRLSDAEREQRIQELMTGQKPQAEQEPAQGQAQSEKQGNDMVARAREVAASLIDRGSIPDKNMGRAKEGTAVVHDPNMGATGLRSTRTGTEQVNAFNQMLDDGVALKDMPPEVLRAAMPYLSGELLTRAKAVLDGK